MSTLDQIRAIHKRAEGRRRLIDLPVWWSPELSGGREVVIRCRPVSAGRLAELGGGIDPSQVLSTAAVTAAVNVIAEATVDIRVLGPGSSDEPLDPEGPARFDPRLGELLGWSTPPADAADAVNRFLRVDEAPLAAIALSGALQEALSGGSEATAREVLGESSAAT